MKYLITLLMCITFWQSVNAQHHIIPEPVSYQQTNENVFILKDQLVFKNETKDALSSKVIAQFSSFIESIGVETSEKKIKDTPSIKFQLNKKEDTELGKEGYVLNISTNEIVLQANEAAGIFNGIQTLKQLLPVTKTTENIQIEACTIKDYPRFAWRGIMLDVSRHFFTVEEIKDYLDKMAAYKLNVFHWHLTDDQGWRIEIKSYPKLTEVGAWRVERHGLFGTERPKPEEGEKATYGGFYTQEQVKEIIQYAAERNITVVPEIDVPGHSMAILAAYPELATEKEGERYVSPGNKFAQWYAGGKFVMHTENTLNPTDEKVYEFLDKVFGELAGLFPSEYLHMGGDECYHGFWERNEEVQTFMKENNIANGDGLQSYFVKRVAKIIESKGKKMIGWDEILEGGLAENTAVMSWRGMKGGIEAAKLKHNVVMSPTDHCYLDYTQGDPTVENIIYDKLSLEESYAFEPVPEGVDAQYILGGQANLWTEVVPTLQFAYYMTFPRAFSIAETLWSPKEKKDWKGFVTKTEAHFTRFDQSNTNICKAIYEPVVNIYKENEKLYCELVNHVPNTEVYFTVDNTYPVKFGQKYTAPFVLPEGKYILRTQTYREGKALGRELMIPKEDLSKRVKEKAAGAPF